MYKKLFYLLICTLYLAIFEGKAQELNCKVVINTDQLQIDQQRGTSQIYRELENVMQEFINGRRWTNDQFQQEERINCSLNIILVKATAQGDYEASARFQVFRPVYGTSYETAILNFFDKSFNFRYLQGSPINYNDNSFTDNLTSMLAFYAYTALTVDYDSFSKLGGNLYVQKLYNLVNLAQVAGGGWVSSNDIRNRYWLSENLQNQQMSGIREGFYTYHRLVLDNFINNPDDGRKQLLEYLNNIRQINQIRPGSALTRMFFDTKSEELLNIFLDANPDDKKKAFTLLTSLDPTRTDAYRRLSK